MTRDDHPLGNNGPLSPPELRFRAELLGAAAQLDQPSALCEQRLLAHFGGHEVSASSPLKRPHTRWRSGLALFGMAAALAVVVWNHARPSSDRSAQALALPVAQEPTQALPPAAPAIGSSLKVWDGDRAGLGAAGWSGPDSKQKTIAAVRGAGVEKSVGLEWHATGSEWMGFGWNWFSWYPPDSGTDISSYRALAFKLRLDGAEPSRLPGAEGLLVGLTSAGGTGKRSSVVVNLASYAPPTFADGRWHQIVIPLSDLWGGRGAEGFDRKSVWELDFGHWSRDLKSFVAYLDDIEFTDDKGH